METYRHAAMAYYSFYGEHYWVSFLGSCCLKSMVYMSLPSACPWMPPNRERGGGTGGLWLSMRSTDHLIPFTLTNAENYSTKKEFAFLFLRWGLLKIVNGLALLWWCHIQIDNLLPDSKVYLDQRLHCIFLNTFIVSNIAYNMECLQIVPKNTTK